MKSAANLWRDRALKANCPNRPSAPTMTRDPTTVTKKTKRSGAMSSETTTKRDYRQEVTDNIIKMLEEGTAPWQKPWQPGTLEMPINPTSERLYRGGNAMQLMATAVMRGYDDPRWLTYRQAQQNGWQVRQGEKGTAIEYWEFPDRSKSSRGVAEPGSDDGPADSKQPRRMIHRVYTV